MNRRKMSKSAGNATKSFPSLSECVINAMRFYLLQQGASQSTATAGCALLSPATNRLCKRPGKASWQHPRVGVRLSKSLQTQRRIRPDRTPPSLEAQVHHSFLQKTPPQTAEESEDLHPKSGVKGYYDSSSHSPLPIRPAVTNYGIPESQEPPARRALGIQRSGRAGLIGLPIRRSGPHRRKVATAVHAR